MDFLGFLNISNFGPGLRSGLVPCSLPVRFGKFLANFWQIFGKKYSQFGEVFLRGVAHQTMATYTVPLFGPLQFVKVLVYAFFEVYIVPDYP